MKCYLSLLLCALVLLSGCGYGQVSPTAYEYAKSLYNISNRKLADRVPDVRQKITDSHANGEISDQEVQWLTAIVDDAADGDWKSAMKSARRLMEDQTDR